MAVWCRHLSTTRSAAGPDPGETGRRPWRAAVEVAEGDVGGDLAEAMDGVDVAVYLVHSIGQGNGWALREQRERWELRPFRDPSGNSPHRVPRRLGRDTDVSDHGGVGTTSAGCWHQRGSEVVELRAGVVIGSGSASFEMLRYLVEVLPVMVTPRWVETRCQPIAIADVVDLLVEAVTRPGTVSGIYGVGGPDIVTYAQMMALYAELSGLPRRRLVRVPLLTPGLSSTGSAS